MSSETRDARLGLTGLTPEQREERLRLLARELARKQTQARVELEKTRAIRRPTRGGALR